jgi:hypothetical protein
MVHGPWSVLHLCCAGGAGEGVIVAVEEGEERTLVSGAALGRAEVSDGMVAMEWTMVSSIIEMVMMEV